MKRCAALNLSPSTSFLDHIAPLASLLGIPLISLNEDHVARIKAYYPEVQLRYEPELSFHLKELCEEFDRLVSCGYWAKEFGQSLQDLYGKKMQLIFCPHGQSDKGYAAPLLAPYALQDAVLLYGPLMKQMVDELQIRLPKAALIGNYRKIYYEKHRLRHLKLAEEQIFSQLEKNLPTLLYAPTWNDQDRGSSFIEVARDLILNKPPHWNLLIKAHPQIAEKEAGHFFGLPLPKKGVVVDCDFPLIYPVLERADAYLGDYSSVGYDALAFDLPLFFLQKPHLPPMRLHECGEILASGRDLFQTLIAKIPQAKRFEEKRRKLYSLAFDPRATLQSAMEHLIERVSTK